MNRLRRITRIFTVFMLYHMQIDIPLFGYIITVVIYAAPCPVYQFELFPTYRAHEQVHYFLQNKKSRQLLANAGFYKKICLT